MNHTARWGRLKGSDIVGCMRRGVRFCYLAGWRRMRRMCCLWGRGRGRGRRRCRLRYCRCRRLNLSWDSVWIVALLWMDCWWIWVVVVVRAGVLMGLMRMRMRVGVGSGRLRGCLGASCAGVGGCGNVFRCALWHGPDGLGGFDGRVRPEVFLCHGCKVHDEVIPSWCPCRLLNLAVPERDLRWAGRRYKAPGADLSWSSR